MLILHRIFLSRIINLTKLYFYEEKIVRNNAHYVHFMRSEHIA